MSCCCTRIRYARAGAWKLVVAGDVKRHGQTCLEMGRKAVERARPFPWDHFVDRLDEYVERHC